MRTRLILVAIVSGACALAAVASALAAGGTKTKSGAHHAIRHATAGGPGQDGGPGGGPGPGGAGGGPGAVHSVSVVLDKKGDGFITVTTDSGKIKSVDAAAGTIELAEEANSVTYQTVTLTVPSGSTVTLDGNSSSLEGLTAGDHVTVSSSTEGTTVFATDSSFHPQGPGPGGPPPGAGMPAGG